MGAVHITSWYPNENSLLSGSFLIKFASLFSDKDRITDSWISEGREFARSPCRSFVAQWLERPTDDWKTQVLSPARLRCVFHLIQLSVLLSLSREEGREFDYGIQSSMEAILACHPALSTEWLAGWQTRVYMTYAHSCTRNPEVEWTELPLIVKLLSTLVERHALWWVLSTPVEVSITQRC